MARYPDKLLWCDLETANLDIDTELLEVACILTDFDLNEISRYEAPVAFTERSIEQIKNDDYVRNMHLESGLLKACKHEGQPLQGIETAIIDQLIAAGAEPQKVMLAGSGVARFDYDRLVLNMPDLGSWLAYFVLDVGIVRRMAHIATKGGDVFPLVEESFREGIKKHRAMADVEAHLEEGRGQFDVFRQVAATA